MRLQLQGTILFPILKSPSGTFLVPGMFRTSKSNFGNLLNLNVKVGVTTFLYSTTASEMILIHARTKNEIKYQLQYIFSLTVLIAGILRHANWLGADISTLKVSNDIPCKGVRGPKGMKSELFVNVRNHWDNKSIESLP